MKKYLAAFALALCTACTSHTPVTQQGNADSLKAEIKELKEKYRPGLGEIMGGIQTHHAKLWFAGINSNWKLSAFEIAEIKERLEQAMDIETDRPEVKYIPMIYPAVDSLTIAIQAHNLTAFKKDFQMLTNTCNSCHAANHFEFNVITIPTAPPVSNQDFTAH